MDATIALALFKKTFDEQNCFLVHLTFYLGKKNDGDVKDT